MRWFVAAWLVLVAGIARADDPPALDAAVKQAVAAGKPLVIEFHASWCGPCHVFETTVLPDPRVQKALETVLFVQYDIDTHPGIDAAQRLGYVAVPTFVTVDASGIERARRQGMLPVDELIKFVVAAGVQTLDRKSVDELLKKQPADPQVRMQAASWYAQQRRNSEAIGQWQHVMRDKTAPAELRAEATRRATRLQRIEDWRHDLSAEQVAQIRGDLQKVDPAVLAAALIGSPLSDREKQDLLKQVLDAQTDLDALNTLVYVALAAHANDLALTAATKVIAARRDAPRLDTLAECNHALGRTTDALALEDEAIGLASGSGNEPKLRANRKRFETTSEAAPETQVYEARAQALWKQVDDADQVPERVATPASSTRAAAMRQMMATQRAFWDSERKAATSIVAACRGERGTAEAVVARFAVTADGHLDKIVLLTDPAASKALKACIEKQLAATTLAPPGSSSRRESLTLEFP